MSYLNLFACLLSDFKTGHLCRAILNSQMKTYKYKVRSWRSGESKYKETEFFTPNINEYILQILFLLE